MALRTVLADDHIIVRDGIQSILEASGKCEIVAVESDGDRALAAIREHRPDVAVLDIEMPGLSGIEIARKLGESHAHCAVLLLSMYAEPELIRSALLAGVSGYLVKEDAAQDLVEALAAVARGDVYISSRIGGAVVDVVRRPGTPAPQLTPRERDVLRLLCDGLTSKEIASRLELQPKTVHGHRSAIMEKLNIHSVAGLVKYAIRHQLSSL